MEITSITAAEHKLRKPIRVTRPGKAAQTTDQRVEPQVKRATETHGETPERRAINLLFGAQPARRRKQTEASDDDQEQTA